MIDEWCKNCLHHRRVHNFDRDCSIQMCVCKGFILKTE